MESEDDVTQVGFLSFGILADGFVHTAVLAEEAGDCH